MSVTVTGPGGVTVDFPDGTHPDVIDQVMRRAIAPDQPNTTMDALKSFGTGAMKSVIGIAGLPGMAQDAIGAGMDYLQRKRFIPQSPGTPQQQAAAIAGAPDLLPSADTIQKSIEGVTGEFHRPETRVGRYAETIGEFLPNAAVPGGAIRRAAQVIVPAAASERAGEATKGTGYEGISRIAAALAGGLGATGVEGAIGRARSGVPGMSPAASRVLEKNITPGAEARLTELGPEAMLLDSTVPAMGIAKGIAVRPGPAQDTLVSSVTQRNRGATARLDRDVQANFGQYEDPNYLRQTIDDQMEQVGKQYPGATRGVQRIDPSPVIKELDQAISSEAGKSQRALKDIKSYFYRPSEKVRNPDGSITTNAPKLKTDAYELHRVRMAIDDLYKELGDSPVAQGLVTNFRKKLDALMPQSVKRVDASMEDLFKQNEALDVGVGKILRSGPEAMTPEGLRRLEVSGGSGGGQISQGQASMLQAGTRADIGRMVGTNSNDVTALRKLVGGEGDWNREKLAQIFGPAEADRVIGAVDREAAFQQAYRDLTQNSQTAQRLMGEKAVPGGETRQADLKSVTLPGLALSGVQKAVQGVRGLMSNANVRAADEELSRHLVSTGTQRDDLVQAIRESQRRRQQHSTPTRDMLIRAIFNMDAGSLPGRTR